MANKKWYEGMYMLNRDPDWWIRIDPTSADACRSSLEKFFGVYGGALTDVACCVFSQNSMVPSNAFYWLGNKYPDYKDSDPNFAESYEKLYKCCTEYNVDPTQIFIDQVNKKGIRPWLSVRMNDAHMRKHPCPLFLEELEAGHMVHDNRCYDYTSPRYRNALKDFIGEVLDKYDFFGLELDFMRWPRNFDYVNNPDCHKIMTEYLREVKTLVSKAEARVGHDIKILIRVPSFPKAALALGFDVETLYKEGTIDAVNPTPLFNNTDSYIPIEEWKAMLGDDAAIIPGLEILNHKYSYNRLENVKGYLAAFYAQGAPGAYLYNYYGHVRTGIWELTPEKCLEGKRHFIVTNEDCFAFPEDRHKPLPIALDTNAERKLLIGKVKSSDKVTLRIDFEGDTAPLIRVADKTDVQGAPTEPITLPGQREVITLSDHTPYSYDISGIETDNEITVKFTGNGTVHYLDLLIDA